VEPETRLPRTLKERLKELALDFEVGLLETACRESSDDFEILFHLGNAYTRSGRYAEGLQVDMKLCSLAPDNPVVHYNLACSLSLLGRIDESLAALRKSLELGYSEFGFIRGDSDMENARRDSRFDEMLEVFEKGKKKT
jgi:tetratricopeptide (TPR) repeat protein